MTEIASYIFLDSVTGSDCEQQQTPIIIKKKLMANLHDGDSDHHERAEYCLVGIISSKDLSSWIFQTFH